MTTNICGSAKIYRKKFVVKEMAVLRKGVILPHYISHAMELLENQKNIALPD